MRGDEGACGGTRACVGGRPPRAGGRVGGAPGISGSSPPPRPEIPPEARSRRLLPEVPPRKKIATVAIFGEGEAPRG